MIRKLIVCMKCFAGRRRSACLLPLVTWSALMLVTVCWLGQPAGRALMPPPPPDQNLNHFRSTRDLQHYLDAIEVLIEPSTPCLLEPTILALVSSTPTHVEHRQAIRDSWGKHLPTYFVLGLMGQKVDENLADVYVEAKLHGDLIVLDMPDHYQNLTLKTMLMLRWTSERCPRVTWLFKTDDDVLVNPWTLRTVVEEHPDAELLGYRIRGSKLHRDQYTKWFVPRWLHSNEIIPEYLSGTGYLVRGKNVKDILTAAKQVPLMNLEDIFLTYLVSKRSLNLELAHDRRLSPYRPWVPLDCAYWALASMHSLKPSDIAHSWSRIERTAKEYERNSDSCSLYTHFFDSDLFLY